MAASPIRLRRPSRFDIALATGFGTAGLVHPLRQADLADPWSLVAGLFLLVVAAVAVVWRRQFPLSVLTVVTAAAFTCQLAGAGGSAGLLVALALYTVTASRPWWWAVGCGLAVALTAAVAVGVGAGGGGPRPEDLVWVTGTVMATGMIVRGVRRTQAGAVERAEAAARSRAERELQRMAYEVHDVVTHSLAVINVQAGVAAHVADQRPEQAREALVAIKIASRTALADLRASVGVLNSPVGGPAVAGSSELAGLARLGELARAGESAGLTVVVRGEQGDLPATVDRAAFRIVREAVTNTVRHAVGARQITIDLIRRGDVLRLRVRDDGRTPPVPVPGSGLRGMADRAAELGGRLSAGPTAGGFQVEADLPTTRRPDADNGPTGPR
ncbi:histidine kinase [Plantactinospora sp. ZYX-F-223]|uniref:sensor histidine kinase n=1 Tax=Plantactinospora sp. ZYX-F-223 TaxID=3144103 RepID=UPI0031FD160E